MKSQLHNTTLSHPKSIFLLFFLASTITCSNTQLPITYHELIWLPTNNFLIPVKIDHYNDPITMIPSFYGGKTVLNLDCEQLMVYLPDESVISKSKFDELTPETITFPYGIVEGRILPIHISSAFAYQDSVLASESCQLIKDKEFIFYIQDTLDTIGIFSLDFGGKEFVILIHGPQGYIADGYDSRLGEGVQEIYRLGHGSYFFNTLKIARRDSHLRTEIEIRRATFDLSTSFIWMPKSDLGEILLELSVNFGVVCTKDSGNWNEYICEVDTIEELPTFSLGSTDLFPDLYLEQYRKGKYSLKFRAHEDREYGERLEKAVEIIYANDIIIGTCFFKYYLARFMPFEHGFQNVAIIKKKLWDYEKPDRGAFFNDWVSIVALDTILLLMITAFVLYQRRKKSQLRKKKEIEMKRINSEDIDDSYENNTNNEF